MTTTPTNPITADLRHLLDFLGRTQHCLHVPGTPEYDAAVAAWNVAIAPCPVAVVEAETTHDVVAAVRFAKRHGLTVTVQATGHGIASTMAGSLLVSTRKLTSLEIDPGRHLATAGAGVKWEQVLEAGAPHGLAGLAGSAPDVGVVGYTTGGGVGPLARTCGLASDRVHAFELVTGDGELRRATTTENPDLFWALRGGKGLLGIVTSIEFELLPISEIYGGAVYFDGDDASAVLHRWATWSAGLPREATTSAALLRLPAMPDVPPPLAGRLTVAVRFAWTGDPGRGAEVFAPIREAAASIVDMVAVMPYAALGSIHSDPVAPMPTHEEHALLGDLTPEAVDALLTVAGPGSDSAQVIVEVRQLGGALTGGGPIPSAYSPRHAAHSLMTIGIGVPPVVDAVTADAGRVLEAMSPWKVWGGLPNFAPRPGAAWLQRSYDAATLRRLAKVSRAYDPKSVILGAATLRTFERRPLAAMARDLVRGDR